MNEKLKKLRIDAHMTQEDLAERMNVSRQSVAKWESGESVPDVIKCGELARIFGLHIEDIAVTFMRPEEQEGYRPKNKYIFGKCTITDRKIDIPEEAMKVFGLKEGDELVLFGDIEQGMALVPLSTVTDFIQELESAPSFRKEVQS